MARRCSVCACVTSPFPQPYAEADVRQPHDRSADRMCRCFPLRWRDLVHPGLLSEQRRHVLRSVWLANWAFPGVYEPIPCVCGIAAQLYRPLCRHRWALTIGHCVLGNSPGTSMHS